MDLEDIFTTLGVQQGDKTKNLWLCQGLHVLHLHIIYKCVIIV